MKKCGAPRPTYPVIAFFSSFVFIQPFFSSYITNENSKMWVQGGINSNGSSGKKEQGEAPEGSWTCSKCSNLNYPFRTVCNRKGCGNERPAPSSTPN